MGRYVLKKIFSFVITALLTSFITFGALNILPGDPAVLILGTEGDPQTLAALRSELGLDRPAIVRYGQWLVDFAQGDMGTSIRYSRPVQDLISSALPISLILAASAVGAALLIAIPFGVKSAVSRGSLWGGGALVFSQLGMAVPQFWVGILLIQWFAVRLKMFPAGGYNGWFSLILPTITLSLPRAAILTRMVHTGITDVLNQDYVRTARAKGLTEHRVFYKHALINGAIGVFTIAGIQLTELLAGTIVVEQVFGLPGLGQLLLSGVLQRDIPLVQGVVVTVAILILFANLIFDLALMLLDPRIRFE